MQPEVLAAVVSALSTAAVAIAALVLQRKAQDAQLRTEAERQREQRIAETAIRTYEWRREQLLNLVSEVLTNADVDHAPTLEAGRTALLAKRAQLLIDRTVPAERHLNGKLNAFASFVEDFIASGGPRGPDSGSFARELLTLEGQLTDAASAVFCNPAPPATLPVTRA